MIQFYKNVRYSKCEISYTQKTNTTLLLEQSAHKYNATLQRTGIIENVAIHGTGTSIQNLHFSRTCCFSLHFRFLFSDLIFENKLLKMKLLGECDGKATNGAEWRESLQRFTNACGWTGRKTEPNQLKIATKQPRFLKRGQRSLIGQTERSGFLCPRFFVSF